MRSGCVFVVTLAVGLAGCAAETRVVSVDLAPGAELFGCADATGEDLLRRAIDEPTLAVVVDFIATGDVPLCQPLGVRAWCRERQCDVVARSCLEVDIEGLSSAEAIRKFQEAVDGFVVTENAPDGPVIVRAIVSAESCDVSGGLASIDARPNPEKGITCMIGCAPDLDSVAMSVRLDVFRNEEGVCGLAEVALCERLPFQEEL
ncbi:MAG: hypothetical protein AAGF12_06995 [Myxococcota bacterium]